MEYNFSNVLLILQVKYFYNRLLFKVVIDKSCRTEVWRVVPCSRLCSLQPVRVKAVFIL